MGRIVFLVASLLYCRLLIAVDASILRNTCVITGQNYTSGSVYEDNLKLLLGSLIVKSSSLKFYNTTAGVGVNKVYGLFQCRYDFSPEVCRKCVKDATQSIVTECPLNGEAISWYHECMLRFAGRSNYSEYDVYTTEVTIPYKANVTNYDKLAPILADALEGVINNASSATPPFAFGEAKWTLFDRVYTFAQCTPNINSNDCNFCLRTALSKMISCCETDKMVMVFFPSCQLKYDTIAPIINFTYQSTPIPPPLSNPPGKLPPPNSISGGSKKLTMIVAIAVCILGGFVVLLVILCIFLCRKNQKKASNDIAPAPPTARSHGTEEFTIEKVEEEHGYGEHRPSTLEAAKSDGASLGETEFVQYDFVTLKAATGDFSDEKRLGEGGFGTVYKGTLESGENLAIKRLSGTSGQGAKEFMTEARLLAKLQHRNLVKLLGFCSEGSEKLLVYEFVPNASLDGFLFDPSKRQLLDWTSRYNIIRGIASGLQYLHKDSRLTIVHRDLKPSNILLDMDINAKIADFGLAKLFEDAQKFGNTSRIAGTMGYMAPEYMATGQYSDKSDVYSFGIMLLEIVSSQNNTKFYHLRKTEDLPVHAWKLWNMDRSLELIDPILINNYSSNDLTRCVQIALLCLQANKDQRPTMASVVVMLTSSVELPLPSEPAMSFPQFNMPIAHKGWLDGDIDQVSTLSSDTQDLFPKPR